MLVEDFNDNTPTQDYKNESNWLMLGDCLERMKEIPDGSVDMVFTSPPYNLGVSSGGGFPKGAAKGKWSGGSLSSGYNTHDDSMPYEDYINWQKRVLLECWRTLSDDGAIYYNHKPRVQNGLLQTPLTLNPGLPLRQIVIWERNGGINFSPSFYLPTHEWIMIMAKPNFRLRDKKASGAKDVWKVAQERNNSHPAPFPVELPTTAIETTKAKTILDPFMGSGTTGVACANTNRKFIGIEKDEKYFSIAKDRILNTLKEPSK